MFKSWFIFRFERECCCDLLSDCRLIGETTSGEVAVAASVWSSDIGGSETRAFACAGVRRMSSI